MIDVTDEPITTRTDVTSHERDYSWLAKHVVLHRMNTERGLKRGELSVRRCSAYWFVFNGKVFERLDPEAMGALVRPMLDRCSYRKKMGKKEDSPIVDVDLNPTSGTVHEVLTALVAMPGVMSEDEPDQNEDELVCLNGRICLKTGKLSSHSSRVFATRMVKLEWPESDTAELCAARERWAAHLANLNLSPETLNYVHRALGYACTGRGTEKAFFFHHGVKDTGKSTLIYLAMNVLGHVRKGGYSSLTNPTEWLESRGDSSGHTDGLVGIEGARLVFGDEMPEVSRFNSARIKSNCSGMPDATMRLSAKKEKGRDVPIKWALFFASNWLPATQDKATQDRMKLIIHEHVVPNPDPDFQRKFMTPAMRQVVFQWLVEGARTYIAKGLGTEPASVIAHRAAYAEDNDPIGPFLQEMVKKVTGISANLRAGVKNSDLHRAYVEWAREHGMKATYGIRPFKRMVEERLGVKTYQVGGAAAFKGYCLAYQVGSPTDQEDLDLD